MLMYRPVISLLFFFVSVFASAQTSVSLPRSSPEAEGVSSEGILNFLEAVANSKHELHSFMFLRHGKVIAEGWWNPYRPELKHTMYSLSKSFTSTAIGFAVAEKLLTVEDKVISFFPMYLPDSLNDNLKNLRVKHLLTMTVGQIPDPSVTVPALDSIWVKGFLASPVVLQPGAEFFYNSLATYMLSAIVQKLSGQKVIDYLTPRLFRPLGIQGMDWEVDPKGINTGGWGLRIKTEDMAKLGQLYLQNGQWKGKQLLPKYWVSEATTLKILQSKGVAQSKRDSSDWLQGYGYQFWRSRHNTYRGDGAFGQYILVMPDQDVVVAITAETADMQGEINLVWDHLLPAIKTSKLPANPNVNKTLQYKLTSLSLPIPPSKVNVQSAAKISGKTYMMDENNRAKSLLLRFEKNICYLTMRTDKSVFNFGFSPSNWFKSTTTKTGPYLVSRAKAHLTGLRPFKVAGHYFWKDDDALELTLRYIESPHTEKITCHFYEDNIVVDFENSFNKNKDIIVGKKKGF